MRFSYTYKKGFTLIEMLIVVVIIALLAVALIPRLQSVQARAQDARRKGDISKIATALSLYNSDVKSYIALSGFYSTADLVGPLVTSGGYLIIMPRDNWITDTDNIIMDVAFGYHLMTGNYGFMVFPRGGKAAAAALLIAHMETASASNRPFQSNYLTAGNFITPRDYPTWSNSAVNISQYETPCKRVTIASTASFVPDGMCNGRAASLYYVHTQ